MDIFIAIFSAVLFILLYVTRHVNGIKVSPEIELSGAQSIYPCLDSFHLMITGSTIKSTDSDFLRMIRLFYSNDSLSKRDIRDLVYLKEYTVPFNDLLKLDCQSNIQFILESKMHCFQYVARNLITEAVVESSRLFCFPTNQADIDAFNVITRQLNAERSTSVDSHKMNSLRTLQSSNELINSATVTSNQHKYDDFNHINSLILHCECNATTFISLNLNHIAHYFVYFAHGEFKLKINKCHDRHDDALNATGGDGYTGNAHRNEISVNTRVYDKLDDDVCIVNLTSIPGFKRIKVTSVQVDSLVHSGHRVVEWARDDDAQDTSDRSHDDANIHLRDGIFSISPLIPINNLSLFQYLHSSYLRIESKHYYTLQLLLSISHVLDDESLESNLQLLHVIMAAIFAICLFTCCISTVICISAGRDTDKVITSDIMENATMLSDTPATFATGNCNHELIPMDDVCVDETPAIDDVTSDAGKRKQQPSLSQFDLDDVDSMEMDYYDYHCSINSGSGGGKKTPLLRHVKDKLHCTSSEPVTEEESTFNA